VTITAKEKKKKANILHDALQKSLEILDKLLYWRKVLRAAAAAPYKYP
jgi:hypothetical protein